MPFVFTAPAYAERDKHSSLYDKLRDVCDLWIINDVMKLEEFQPVRIKRPAPRHDDSTNVITHEEALDIANKQLSMFSSLGMTGSFAGGIVPTGSPVSTKQYIDSLDISDTETKTQIRITLSGVCGFEVDNIIDYMIRTASKGWDGHVMAKPVEYTEDPAITWEKINVVRT